MKSFNLGLVFKIKKIANWQNTHAMVPTPLLIDNFIRVYYSTRNKDGLSHIAYVDLDSTNPTKVLNESSTYILSPGSIGTFDDCGVTANCVVDLEDKIYMYYIGWNKMVTTPYYNSIGLAISSDRGCTFKRYSQAPIFQRTRDEPYFCTSPWVIKDGDLWHMWYACITNWLIVQDKPEPIYNIKYAYSLNGIDWIRNNTNCIIPLSPDEANARPTVIKNEGKYKMWFCYRGSFDFRDGRDSYRLGYAESIDGKEWIRKDNEYEIQTNGWDSNMQAYPAVIYVGKELFMFYNGNSFGKEGFGCSVLEN